MVEKFILKGTPFASLSIFVMSSELAQQVILACCIHSHRLWFHDLPLVIIFSLTLVIQDSR